MPSLARACSGTHPQPPTRAPSCRCCAAAPAAPEAGAHACPPAAVHSALAVAAGWGCSAG